MNWRVERGGSRVLEIGDVTHTIGCRPGTLEWELTSVRWEDSRYGVQPEMIDHNWFKTLRDAKNYVEKRIKNVEPNQDLSV